MKPFLFSRSENEDAWINPAVLAPPWWLTEETNRTIGIGYPNLCNTAGASGFFYAVYAAWRHAPERATIGVTASLGLKLW